MGFFDKLKDKAKQLKEENRNFGSTMKRMNNHAAFYGEVNRGIKNGDFWEGSYINIEDSKGVIYGSNQDDYVFGPDDIQESKFAGQGREVPLGNLKEASMRYNIVFKDGKKAQMDVIASKVDLFKMSFGL